MIEIADRDVQQLIRLYRGHWRSFLIELLLVSVERGCDFLRRFSRYDHIDTKMHNKGTIDAQT